MPMLWPILTARLLLCVENFLLLPPFPVMPNAALLYVESSVRFLVKERDLSLKFLDSDFTSVRILGEGDGLLGAISGLCQCVLCLLTDAASVRILGEGGGLLGAFSGIARYVCVHY